MFHCASLQLSACDVRWLAVDGGVKSAQEVLMRKQLLAGTVVVALATGMTTSAMAFEPGTAGTYHRGGYGHGRHHGWSGRHIVGGHSGWGYGPSHGDAYYEGIAPFGRLVGRPTGGLSFFVGF
jgi:hypothetical protein